MLSALSSFLFSGDPEEWQQDDGQTGSGDKPEPVSSPTRRTSTSSSANNNKTPSPRWGSPRSKKKRDRQRTTSSALSLDAVTPAEEDAPVPGSLSGFFSQLLGLTPDDLAEDEDESTGNSAGHKALVAETRTSPRMGSASESFESLDAGLQNPADLLFSEDWMPSLTLINRTSKEKLMTLELAHELRKHVPALLKEACAWSLVYSTAQHGISLHTLYRSCSEVEGPLMIVIQDEHNRLFGAFSSDPIHVQTGFYGDGSCFLWKQKQTETPVSVDVYKATGKNTYLVYTEAHCLAFGGG